MIGVKDNSYVWETVKSFQYSGHICPPLLPLEWQIFQPNSVAIKCKRSVSHTFLIYRSDGHILFPLNIQHFLSTFLNNWSLSICSGWVGFPSLCVCTEEHVEVRRTEKRDLPRPPRRSLDWNRHKQDITCKYQVYRDMLKREARLFRGSYLFFKHYLKKTQAPISK